MEVAVPFTAHGRPSTLRCVLVTHHSWRLFRTACALPVLKDVDVPPIGPVEATACPARHPPFCERAWGRGKRCQQPARPAGRALRQCLAADAPAAAAALGVRAQAAFASAKGQRDSTHGAPPAMWWAAPSMNGSMPAAAAAPAPTSMAESFGNAQRRPPAPPAPGKIGKPTSNACAGAMPGLPLPRQDLATNAMSCRALRGAAPAPRPDATSSPAPHAQLRRHSR